MAGTRRRRVGHVAGGPERTARILQHAVAQQSDAVMMVGVN